MKDLTVTTKRIIVTSIGLVGLVAAVGWASNLIETKDAMLILGPIITGFFGLLKGVE